MRRKKKFSSNKLVTVILVVLVAIVITGCAIGYYINANRMEEISVEDETVTALATKYFRGPSACTDYALGLFSDGAVSAKDLDYDTKQEITIDYAVRKGYDNLGFAELKEIYALLFNDGTSLKESSYYEATSGYYEKNGDVYNLTAYSACAAAQPYEMVCIVPDKAYRNDRSIKYVVGLYSGTAETQNLYSGLNWDDDSFIGVYGEIEPTDSDLAKWEIVYKYDDKLGHYFLDYTKKL